MTIDNKSFNFDPLAPLDYTFDRTTYDAGRGGAPRSGRAAVAEHPGQGHILDRITEQM